MYEIFGNVNYATHRERQEKNYFVRATIRLSCGEISALSRFVDFGFGCNRTRLYNTEFEI